MEKETLGIGVTAVGVFFHHLYAVMLHLGSGAGTQAKEDDGKYDSGQFHFQCKDKDYSRKLCKFVRLIITTTP